MDSQTPQAVPPPPPIDMNAVINWLWNTARTHGLPFCLLVSAVCYFHQRTEHLEADIKDCQQRHLETIELQNGALVKALEQNTQALTRLETTITRR